MKARVRGRVKARVRGRVKARVRGVFQVKLRVMFRVKVIEWADSCSSAPTVLCGEVPGWAQTSRWCGRNAGGCCAHKYTVLKNRMKCAATSTLSRVHFFVYVCLCVCNAHAYTRICNVCLCFTFMCKRVVHINVRMCAHVQLSYRVPAHSHKYHACLCV